VGHFLLYKIQKEHRSMEQIMSGNYHKMHLGVVNGLMWLSAELYLLGSEGRFHIFLSLMQRFKA
jgi:hypothetical protein